MTLKSGDTIAADLVMYATGRNPNTSDMGLEEVGVELDGKGAVRVDRYSKTSVPNIYAIGDVTNRMNLTPVAINEGRAFAESLYAGPAALPRLHERTSRRVFESVGGCRGSQRSTRP